MGRGVKPYSPDCRNDEYLGLEPARGARWSGVDIAVLVAGLALLVYTTWGLLFCWLGGTAVSWWGDLCPDTRWFRIWPYVAFPVPGGIVAVFVLVTLRRVNNYFDPWHWFLTWREVILSSFALLAVVWTVVAVIAIAVVRTYWFDVNACADACPWEEDCWTLRTRAPRVRVDGRAISDYLHGPAAAGLSGGVPQLTLASDAGADACGFEAFVPVLHDGVEIGRVNAELRCPGLGDAPDSPGVLVLVTPPIGWDDHTWAPTEAVPVLRIDQVETLYSKSGAAARYQGIDLGAPRSVLRSAFEARTKLPHGGGAIAFNADVGEAVLEALTPALAARGLTRFVAGGCSRDGKLAMRWGLVSTRLHAVLSVDSGTGGFSIDSIAHACHETYEILAHPERWAKWMRPGLWPGNEGFLSVGRFEGDLDSMTVDLLKTGKELNVYDSLPMTGWATAQSVLGWLKADGDEDALARFTWTPNDNGGHCHHAIDAPQRRNFVAFVRGDELPDKHPWPDACPKCRDDRERALAEDWLLWPPTL